MASAVGDVRPFFINGEWTHGSGSAFESINPTDGSAAVVMGQKSIYLGLNERPIAWP